MQIAFETPDQPDVHALIKELNAHLYSLYPAENVYALDIASLLQPNVLFAVVRDAAGAYPDDPYSVFMQKNVS